MKCAVGPAERPKNVLDPQDFTGGVGDDQSTPPDYPAGLSSLDDLQDVSLLICPDLSSVNPVETGRDFARSIQTYVDNRPARDLFAILDTPWGFTPDEAAAYKTGGAVRGAPAGEALITSLGAIYYPWTYAQNPVTGLQAPVPPGGAIAGRYAATDANEGAWTAAAGTAAGALSSVTGLERNLDDSQNGSLNVQGVNVIRQFDAFGIVIWGAWTLSPSPDTVYVPLRRTLIYIERSLQQGLQWLRFQSNDAALWAGVERSVSAFMTDLWRDGGLQGADADSAFQVRCGLGSTMTAADVAAGRVIVQVMAALIRPAEFSVISLEFQTGDAAPN